MSAAAGEEGSTERHRSPEGEGAPSANLPFGEYLAGERERIRLSLDEAAAAIRVPVKHLEALETERYDGLPPKPYVKGFLDAYARFLGVDSAGMTRRFEESLNAYRSSREESREPIFALFLPRGEKLHWRDCAIPIVLALAVVLFVVGRWFFVAETGDSGSMLIDPVVEIVETPPESLGGARETDRQEQPEESLAAPDAAVKITLAAEASTWVSARRDGGEVEERTIRGGETVSLSAREEIVLSIGNAGAVRLTYNGRELGFIGHKGQVKRELVFTAGEE